MNHRQFRISDLLSLTAIIALLCSSYQLAPLIDQPNASSIRAILISCMIASVPFSFIASLIRQPISSSRMWNSFLFTVLLSAWVGFLSAEIPIKRGNFPGTGAILAVGIGMIVSLICSMLVPCFCSSRRKELDDSTFNRLTPTLVTYHADFDCVDHVATTAGVALVNGVKSCATGRARQTKVLLLTNCSRPNKMTLTQK